MCIVNLIYKAIKTDYVLFWVIFERNACLCVVDQLFHNMLEYYVYLQLFVYNNRD